MRRKNLIWIAPLAVLGIALFLFIGGEIVKLLWNWLLPPLFGFRRISIWQALGLLALCRILFGGLAGRGSGDSAIRSRVHRRMEEHCGQMTPEERERFRQRLRERWGFAPAASGTKDLMNP